MHLAVIVQMDTVGLVDDTTLVLTAEDMEVCFSKLSFYTQRCKNVNIQGSGTSCSIQ